MKELIIKGIKVRFWGNVNFPINPLSNQNFIAREIKKEKLDTWAKIDKLIFDIEPKKLDIYANCYVIATELLGTGMYKYELFIPYKE